MKTGSDPRHQKRIHKMQQLFAASFGAKSWHKDIAHILSHRDTLDAIIARAAPEWPVDKISKIDLAILRLAVYELTVEKTAPPKVVIDEAVELAKSYGNTSSSAFVNGVLGTIMKSLSVSQTNNSQGKGQAL